VSFSVDILPGVEISSSAVERVFRVLRRAVDCLTADALLLAAVVLRDDGAADRTVDVERVVTVVITLVSLSSSSDSGGGEGIVFRRRLGED